MQANNKSTRTLLIFNSYKTTTISSVKTKTHPLITNHASEHKMSHTTMNKIYKTQDGPEIKSKKNHMGAKIYNYFLTKQPLKYNGLLTKITEISLFESCGLIFLSLSLSDSSQSCKSLKNPWKSWTRGRTGTTQKKKKAIHYNYKLEP